jgi:hypothetical protein
MKTAGRLISGCLLASLIISGVVFASSSVKGSKATGTTAATQEVKGGPDGIGKHGAHNPLGLLSKFQSENMAVQTISELSSQSVETVAAKLKENRLPKVLADYSITREAFQTAMKPKFIALVHKNVENGSITAAQETLIIEALEKQETRQEIMEKLIENGVTAGIITQEEADRMLSGGEEEPPAE